MKKALAIISAAALLAGCQMADEAFSPSAKSAKQFYGTIASETRTAISQDGDVYHVNWQVGDEITVTDGALIARYTAGEGGSPSTYFVQLPKTDTLVAGPYTAYYPSTIVNGFPGMQEYGKTVVPMAAQSPDENLTFKNLGSLLKINVKSSAANVAVKYLVLSADQPMAGAFTIVDDAAVVSEGTGVTLDCGAGVAVGATEVPFYVTVAPGEYTNFSVKMIAADGRSQTVKMKAGNTLKAERSKFHEIGLEFNNLADAPALGGDAFLPDGPVFNATLKQLYDPLATESTLDNSVVKKIVFDTKSVLTSELQIEDLSSDNPIYASFDAGSGVITISTPAETIYTSADASYMFQGFGACEAIENLKCLNTENTESMLNMFCMYGCDTSYIKTLDLSSFNTSNVYTFRSMFNGLRALESIDLSKFDSSNCESMRLMFRDCTTLESIDLSMLNVENATDLYGIVYNCLSLKDINTTGWNTENVADFSYMFYKCWGLEKLDLSHFDTSCGTTFANMFYWCRNLTELNVSGFDTSSATSLGNMFNSCYKLRQLDLSSFSCESLTLGSDRINGMDYIMNQLGALEELWLGENFGSDAEHPCLSSAFVGAVSQTEVNNRTCTCNTTGTLVIHCTQDVADWCARTALRWVNTGWRGADAEPTRVIPVTFVDITTGRELSVVWRSN